MECSESDCDRQAAVELHVPWTDNRLVCAAHARVLGRQDGVVADPLPDSELLEGSDGDEDVDTGDAVGGSDDDGGGETSR